jgi:hypothetical protein
MFRRITSAVVNFVRRLVRRVAPAKASMTANEVVAYLRQHHATKIQIQILHWAHHSDLRIADVDPHVLKALGKLGDSPAGLAGWLSSAWYEIWIEIQNQDRLEREQRAEQQRRQAIATTSAVQEKNRNVLRSLYDRDDDPRAALARAIKRKP